MSTHRRLLQFLAIVTVLSMMFSGFSVPAASAQGGKGIELQPNTKVGETGLIAQLGGRSHPPVQVSESGLPTNQIIVKYKSSTSAFTNPKRASQMERVSQATGLTLKYFRAMSGNAHVLRLPQQLSPKRVQAITERLM